MFPNFDVTYTIKERLRVPSGAAELHRIDMAGQQDSRTAAANVHCPA
jgi:hypothetical protein